MSNIKDIQIRELNIPFNVSFKHASAKRIRTESLIVIAKSVDNNLGYGEGCPRSYVTSETIKSCFDFFEVYKPLLLEIKNLKGVKSLLENYKKDIDKNPSIWCAIEIALLDLIAKEQNQSIEALLNLSEIDNDFYYSAVLGDSSYDTFKAQLEKYIQMRFKDFKVKLSGNLKIDRQRIDIFRALEDIRVRLDANNLWRTPNEAIAYIKELEYPFFALEEPLNINQYDNLRIVSKELNTRIVLDESFLREEQFQHIESTPDLWIINIRVSKMGGILRSLNVARMAKKRNIKVIIGAQVGETSILTRAGITIANAFRDVVVAQEGAFGTYLLKEDICNPSIIFGNAGVISAKQISDKNIHGLGLQIDLE